VLRPDCSSTSFAVFEVGGRNRRRQGRSMALPYFGPVRKMPQRNSEEASSRLLITLSHSPKTVCHTPRHGVTAATRTSAVSYLRVSPNAPIPSSLPSRPLVPHRTCRLTIQLSTASPIPSWHRHSPLLDLENQRLDLYAWPARRVVYSHPCTMSIVVAYLTRCNAVVLPDKLCPSTPPPAPERMEEEVTDTAQLTDGEWFRVVWHRVARRRAPASIPADPGPYPSAAPGYAS
jgi:hypothetical protein